MRRRALTTFVAVASAALLGACESAPAASCEPLAVVDRLTALRQYDIFRLDEDGSLDRLTNDRRSFSPAVLPDGSGIVITRGGEGTHEECCGYADTYLEVIDLDGVVVSSIPREEGWNDSSAAVSPDCSHLAFVRREKAHTEVKVVVADMTGNNARPLVTLRALTGVPSWSPDGERLAVTTEVHDVSGTPVGALMLIDPDDGTTMEVGAGQLFGSPAWSTDGRHIVLAGRGYESPHPLREVTVEDGKVRTIARPAKASRTNAVYGPGRTILSLRYELAVEPEPQLLETIDRDGNVVSDVAIERVTSDEFGSVLVGSLSVSSCFMQ